MSKMVDQIIDVIQGTKKEVLKKISNNVNQDITQEEAVNIVKEQFRTVAEKYNVQESTVRSKCTRELTMVTEEFANAVIEYITRKNNVLLNAILNNCKCTKGDDSKANIRSRMSSI